MPISKKSNNQLQIGNSIDLGLWWLERIQEDNAQKIEKFFSGSSSAEQKYFLENLKSKTQDSLLHLAAFYNAPHIFILLHQMCLALNIDCNKFVNDAGKTPEKIAEEQAKNNLLIHLYLSSLRQERTDLSYFTDIELEKFFTKHALVKPPESQKKQKISHVTTFHYIRSGMHQGK